LIKTGQQVVVGIVNNQALRSVSHLHKQIIDHPTDPTYEYELEIGCLREGNQILANLNHAKSDPRLFRYWHVPIRIRRKRGIITSDSIGVPIAIS